MSRGIGGKGRKDRKAGKAWKAGKAGKDRPVWTAVAVTAAIALGALIAPSVVALALADVRVPGQSRPAPGNSLPNPYRAVENWAQLGRAWGSTSAVDVDRSGHVPGGRAMRREFVRGLESRSPVLEFDASGKLLKSFGAGLFLQPHGIGVDAAGNVWVTDDQGALPARPSGVQVQPRRAGAPGRSAKRALPATVPTPSISRPTWRLRLTAIFLLLMVTSRFKPDRTATYSLPKGPVRIPTHAS